MSNSHVVRNATQIGLASSDAESKTMAVGAILYSMASLRLCYPRIQRTSDRQSECIGRVHGDSDEIEAGF